MPMLVQHKSPYVDASLTDASNDGSMKSPNIISPPNLGRRLSQITININRTDRYQVSSVSYIISPSVRNVRTWGGGGSGSGGVGGKIPSSHVPYFDDV